ncbi:hypothetical protein FRC00_004990 [Tulasnella sp. 408]|nr:hypothetical protein FRC00_004990 [Tulasnella sp. 408]
MAEVVEDFQLRIDAGVKGARAEFDEFVEKKKAEAEEQTDSGEELKQWANEAARMSQVTDDQLKEKRKQAMIAKMIGLGHDPRDVERAAYSWRPYVTTVFNSPIQLTDSVWKRVKSRAENLVEVEKQRRLEVERRPIRDARRSLARSRYAAFKETYDASPDRLLPQASDFLDLPMIKAVIQDDGDDVSPGIFDDAFDELPVFLDEWRRVRRVDLARMLLESQAAPGDAQDAVTAEKDGILHLATSFFSTCRRCPGSRYGEDSIHWMSTMHRHFARTGRSHAYWIYMNSPCTGMKCIRVVPEYIEGANLLVQAVGLDPKTATTLDMDEIDPRFWCKDCSMLRNGNPNVARSWRNCIMHFGFHAASSPWKGWELLSPDDRATIEANEDAASALQTVDWNKTAISLQCTASNLQGWDCKLKTALPPTPT